MGWRSCASVASILLECVMMRAGLGMILLALAGGCGPDLPATGRYGGRAIDPDGRSWSCTVEIFVTGPDRLHLSLDYELESCQGSHPRWRQCDGDGAYREAGAFRLDAGGEMQLEAGNLSGVLIGALGQPYHVQAVRDAPSPCR
jgi:hypothetical protein